MQDMLQIATIPRSLLADAQIGVVGKVGERNLIVTWYVEAKLA
jgi:hypothetical protein